jgi:hypothetical protein
MKSKQTTIAFTVGMFNTIDGPMYCVYTQGYGMEMSVDSVFWFSVKWISV